MATAAARLDMVETRLMPSEHSPATPEGGDSGGTAAVRRSRTGFRVVELNGIEPSAS